MPAFALPMYRPLRDALTKRCGEYVAGRFANGELQIELQTAVRGENCSVIGYVGPPDKLLLETLLLCHTLKREAAARITAVIPYLGYSRQDRTEPGKSLACAWIGELLRVCGVDDSVTVDIHSEESAAVFPIPVTSLSPAPLFARAIADHSLAHSTIVAPDEGAIERCDAVRRAAGIKLPTAHFKKERTPDGVRHLELVGEVGEAVVIVDDILDTGATLLSGCKLLLAVGVREITIMVTHGLFTGDSWRGLWDLGVHRIFCTDTVPLPPNVASPQISVISAAPLFGEIIP